MLSAIQDKSVAVLETIVHRLEEFEPLQKRPRVFAKPAGSDEDDASSSEGHPSEEVPKTEKLKQLSYELIDIGIHTSQLALEVVQQSTPYQHVQERLSALDEQFKEGKVQLYRFLNDSVYTPLTSNLYVIYDRSSHMVSFLMQVLLDNQARLKDYIGHHYENVTILLKDNWMRLDFNKDGSVSLDDIRHSAQELLEFLKSFDYMQKATEIKSSLYQEAIKYIKKDLNGGSGAGMQELQELRGAGPSFYVNGTEEEELR